MSIKTAFMRTCIALGAALAACTMFAGAGVAKDPEVTVAYQVTTQGLDVRQIAGARELYARLKHAAQIVCTHGMRVDLKAVDDENTCYEKALANSIRSSKLPLLTQVYLETHTVWQAAANGIALPTMIAAK